jgi:hypothetical protein
MSDNNVPPAPSPQFQVALPYPYPPAQQPARPGRTLGIVGFVMSFIGFIDVAGLIISIVAMVKSRRAGQKNGFALAGIIISIVGILFCGGMLALIVPPLVQAAQECARLGDGEHVVGNATYICTPTGFSVTSN